MKHKSKTILFLLLLGYLAISITSCGTEKKGCASTYGKVGY